ncbi:MAG: 50S ribosomal protein L21 [Candidatus Levyibacteriota bacterium]
MEYAVIETGGKQFKVSSGLTLDVENLGVESGEFSFDKVLLHVSGEDITLGKPYIEGFSIKAKVNGAKKGEKIRASKFKGKSRYRKTVGFRQSLTSIEILAFSKPVQKSAPKKADK